MFFLAAAMIVVWLSVTLYVLYMGNRQRNLEQELAALEELVSERTAGHTAGRTGEI